MNKIEIFESEEFGTIKTVIKNGEPWFIGRDVAKSLGYSNTKDALSNHVDTEDKRVIQKSENATFEIPNRGLTAINESGLYSLIISSKLQSAKKFKRWVTSEVLPSIRKNGTYEQKALGPMEMLELQFSALKEQKEKIAEHDERLSKIEDLSEVTTGQAVTIKKLVDKKVYEALKDAYHNKEIRNRTYKTIWKDYKAFFNITSYHCTLKKDFEKALEIVTNWTPQGELARDIDLSRRQMVC